MADKKYQIFVSSTLKDLEDELLLLLKTILKLNYIPAGMEYFTAIDEGQMKHIERVIDESDYYVLILGARYGSVDKRVDKSYTEQEYDYAVSKGKKVIALLHGNPDEIPQGKTDKKQKLKKKFMAFRERVMNPEEGRIIAFWNDKTELISNFQASLIQTIKLYPEIGWVRGDSVTNQEFEHEFATLKQENQQLKEQIKDTEAQDTNNYNKLLQQNDRLKQDNQELNEQLSDIQRILTVPDVKIEACSASAPEIFSENEIECIAVNFKYNRNLIPDIDLQLFEPKKANVTRKEVYDYYINKAVPWLCNMAKTCRVDLKISNPYPFTLRNMHIEQHVFLHNSGVLSNIENYKIEEPPQNVNLDSSSSLVLPQNLINDLSSHHSTIYTHACVQNIEEDCNIVYSAIITADCINEPIRKDIKINHKIKNVNFSIDQMIGLIQFLEMNNLFNDIGVYRFLSRVI